MKNLIFIWFFFLFATILIAQEKKQIFTSQDEAREAYIIGTSADYESVDRRNGYKLFAGEDTISFPYSTVVKMNVVGGVFWVIQKPWTKFITKNGKIVGRFDCRNKISGFNRLPSIPPPISLLSQVQIPGPKGEKGDRGERGFPGKNGENAEISSNWLLWTGITVAIVIAVVAIFFPKHHDVVIPVDDIGKPPGGHTGPVFSIQLNW